MCLVVDLVLLPAFDPGGGRLDAVQQGALIRDATPLGWRHSLDDRGHGSGRHAGAGSGPLLERIAAHQEHALAAGAHPANLRDGACAVVQLRLQHRHQSQLAANLT